MFWRHRCPSCRDHLSRRFIAKLSFAEATPCPRCRAALRRHTFASATQFSSPIAHAFRMVAPPFLSRTLVQTDEKLPPAVARTGSS